MKLIGTIEQRGTVKFRWLLSAQQRLVMQPRADRAVRVWAESVIVAPEPGESQMDYMLRSMLERKELRLPQETVDLHARRREMRRARRLSAALHGNGEPEIMARLPIEEVS